MGVSWALPGRLAWTVMRSDCWLATRTSVCPLPRSWAARVVRRPAIWKVPSPLPCRCRTSPKESPTSKSSKPVWGLCTNFDRQVCGVERQREVRRDLGDDEVARFLVVDIALHDHY